jgi:hypothetical protein
MSGAERAFVKEVIFAALQALPRILADPAAAAKFPGSRIFASAAERAARTERGGPKEVL